LLPLRGEEDEVDDENVFLAPEEEVLKTGRAEDGLDAEMFGPTSSSHGFVNLVGN